MRNIQVLTPMRLDIIGCDNLNRTLEQTINRQSAEQTAPIFPLPLPLSSPAFYHR
ncbi:MAG: hypothetical protein KKC76_08945 [Proteobacteria bacterium]|nr:hypothetical protein [Pseudomonadota bacterium]MBU4297975.1 hypothetical protein [Pseudomonadota bacterium]MCG2749535.1 hypothetical protein [Desulfobulbaceae bacterium]